MQLHAIINITKDMVKAHSLIMPYKYVPKWELVERNKFHKLKYNQVSAKSFHNENQSFPQPNNSLQVLKTYPINKAHPPFLVFGNQTWRVTVSLLVD